MQYTHFFEKMGIFQNTNIPQKPMIDLPNAQIGRTGLSVLHTGVGGAYKRGIDDHSAYSKIPYFGHILESLEPVYKLPNWRKGVIPQR